MDNECQKACMGSWISNVVERGVLELELRLTDQRLRCLPPQLFASKTLVKLSLGARHRNLPSYVSLPSLKILFIDLIILEDNDLLDVLLAGCPVLEELTSVLDGIPMLDTISSMSVKRLSVRYNCWYGTLSLDLPNLMYLDYSGIASFEYPQVNLESLIEAKLNLYMLICPPDVTNLIMGIRNVKVLHLSSNSVDIIYWCSENGLILPVFNNLVNLSFGNMYKTAWELLAKLLKRSPKLKNLTIKDLNDYTGDISTPLNQVKVLHVLHYRGTNQEFTQLKSILGKLECIKLVQVDVKGNDNDILLQATDDLMMLPTVSYKFHVKIRPLMFETFLF